MKQVYNFNVGSKPQRISGLESVGQNISDAYVSLIQVFQIIFEVQFYVCFSIHDQNFVLLANIYTKKLFILGIHSI